MEVCDQIHATAALPPVTTAQEAGGPHSPSGCGGAKKDPFRALAGNRTLVVQPIA
jgi:hypothetical protein